MIMIYIKGNGDIILGSQLWFFIDEIKSFFWIIYLVSPYVRK